MSLFGTEMQTLWDTINTNLAVQAQINESQPDLAAYLTNQAAMDANIQLVTEVQQGQPAKIASATAAVLVQSKLIQAENPAIELPAQIQTVVSSVNEISEGLDKLSDDKATGIAQMVAGDNIIGAGLDIFNAFTGAQSPQDKMADQIQNIQTMVGDLSINMNYRFDRVDQSLTTIYNTMNQQFSDIEITLNAQGQEIATLNGSVDDIRSSLVTVQDDLAGLEQEIFDDFLASVRVPLVDEMNDCLFWNMQNPNTPMGYSLGEYNYLEMEGDFYNYATEQAENAPCSPKGFTDFSGSGIVNQLTLGPTNTLDNSLNYIKECLPHLGVSTAGTEPLANPRDWFTSAYAYLQLNLEHPMFYREKGYVIPAIKSQGQNLNSFFSSLTFSPGTTNINWNLWNDALKNYYFTNLNAFNTQVSAFELTTATASNFNLGPWRQWDAAAPRVTTTNTAVLGAPEVPTILPREAATSIAAGGYHSLALKADGTVLGWGDDSYGQNEAPAGLSKVVTVAAGLDHNLALNADGTVLGWGDNSDGQTNIPAGLNNVMAIAAGAAHSLALKNDGTVVGWGAGGPGATGYALSLDGTNDYVQAPAGIYFNTNFTIEAWVYVRSYNSWSRLLDFGNGAPSDNVVLALSSVTTGLPSLDVFSASVPNGQQITAPSAIPTNQWVHLAATLENGTATLYINGVAVVSGPVAAPNALITRTNNYIGRSNWSVNSYANAIFDEVRIWSVARSQADIQADMMHPLTGSEPGLVAYWKFDEGSGTNAANSASTGSAYNGTLRHAAADLGDWLGRIRPGHHSSWPDQRGGDRGGCLAQLGASVQRHGRGLGFGRPRPDQCSCRLVQRGGDCGGRLFQSCAEG